MAPQPSRRIWQQSWLWIFVVTAAGAGFLLWVMRPPPPPPPTVAEISATFEFPLPDDPSIAVTTFGGESADVPAAVAREVVAELGRDPTLFVIHFDSSAEFGSDTPARDVATALGVRFVVRGALDWRGDTLTFTGRVTDAVTEDDVWKGRWRHPTEFSTLPAALAALIRLAVTGALADVDAEDVVTPRPDAPIVSAEAWTHYLRGRQHAANRDMPGNAEAASAFEAALAVEPTFAAARIELAFAHYREQQGFEADLTGPARLDLEAEVRAALETDPTNERGHLLLSRLKLLEYTYFRRGDGEIGNRQQAMNALDAAAEIAPGNADLLAYRSRLHTFDRQRGLRAQDDIENAIRLHPAHDWTYGVVQAQNLQLQMFYEEALAVIEPLAEANPDNFRVRREAALVHGLARDVEEGGTHMEALLRLNPDYGVIWEGEDSIHYSPGSYQRDIEALRRVGLP